MDENDNVPEFTQNEYAITVAENAAINPPAALLQVHAIDLDEGPFGEVHYSIKAGNELNLFRLHSESGILYPAKNLTGQKGVYELLISAQDNQETNTKASTCRAIITVMEVNQHRPTFIIPALSNATIEIPSVSIFYNFCSILYLIPK